MAKKQGSHNTTDPNTTPLLDEEESPSRGSDIDRRAKELLSADPSITVGKAMNMARDEIHAQRGVTTNTRVIESVRKERDCMVSTRLPEVMRDKLTEMSISTGLSASALVRLAVSELIAAREARFGRPIPYDAARREP
jgi:hypothetical protein